MSFGWFKQYPADYLHDVASMTLEEKGAYSDIINHIMLYDRALPDDDRYIAGLLRCHVNRWRPIKQRLVAMGKLESNGKTLDVPQVVWVRQARHARKTHLTQVGHRGGIASAEARKSRDRDQAVASSRLEESRSREDKKGFHKRDSSYRGGGGRFDRASYWRDHIQALQSELATCTNPNAREKMLESIAAANEQLTIEEVGSTPM